MVNERLDYTYQTGCGDFTARNSLGANQEVILLLVDSQLKGRHVLSGKEAVVSFPRTLCINPFFP